MDETKSWQAELNDRRLKTRGWYGCIAPDGWKWIVEDCDRLLAKLDPKYEITQVKEKFGTLRYYYETVASRDTQEIMDAVVSEAERLSARTCEGCGNSSAMSNLNRGIKYDSTAVLKSSGGWYRTICDSCDTEGRYVSVDALNAREQYEDLEFYAGKAREQVQEGQDILDVFLKIAKKDLLEE